jgi:lysophospholipid acyltransferase (LPLAT)-like uncharacterized protein
MNAKDRRVLLRTFSWNMWMKLATVYGSCIGTFEISLSKYIIKATWDKDTPPTPNSQFHDHFTWEG